MISMFNFKEQKKKIVELEQAINELKEAQKQKKFSILHPIEGFNSRIEISRLQKEVKKLRQNHKQGMCLILLGALLAIVMISVLIMSLSKNRDNVESGLNQENATTVLSTNEDRSSIEKVNEVSIIPTERMVQATEQIVQTTPAATEIEKINYKESEGINIYFNKAYKCKPSRADYDYYYFNTETHQVAEIGYSTAGKGTYPRFSYGHYYIGDLSNDFLIVSGQSYKLCKARGDANSFEIESWKTLSYSECSLSVMKEYFHESSFLSDRYDISSLSDIYVEKEIDHPVLKQTNINRALETLDAEGLKIISNGYNSERNIQECTFEDTTRSISIMIRYSSISEKLCYAQIEFNSSPMTIEQQIELLSKIVPAFCPETDANAVQEWIKNIEEGNHAHRLHGVSYYIEFDKEKNMTFSSGFLLPKVS